MNREMHVSCSFNGLMLLFVFVAASSAPAKELADDSLFAADRLLEVAIELPAEDWAKLRQQTRDIRTAFTGGTAESPFSYFKANITIDGVRIESVGLRKKGFIGSLDNQFPSLKVKLDEYVKQRPIKGIDVLTLNNNKQDPSLLSQFLTYQVFNAAGVHAPRVSFAKVTVNGEYLGIYSNVESIGKPFLKRRFDNSSGNLYEGTLADFYPAAIDRLEAKTNEKDHDRSKVLQLARLLAAKDEGYLSKVEELVDTENFLKFWALESLLKFWDGYSNNQNNYWVYENATNRKLYFIPWGADAAFMEARAPFAFGPAGATSVYAESILANRLYNDGPTAERYRTAMREILTKVWKENELLQQVDDLEKLLADHLHRRQASATRSMNDVRNFIRTRRKAVEKELETWPVRVAAQPRKPNYKIELGTAGGSFNTVWSDKPAADAPKAESAELRLQLENKDVALAKVNAASRLMQLPRFPGFGPPGPPPGAPPAPPAAPPGTAPAPPPAAPPAARPGPPGPPPGDGGPFGRFEPPATIVLTATRESDGKLLTLTLTVDAKVFVASRGKEIEVMGTLADGEGGGGFMPFGGGRQVSGQLTLDEVGMKPGDKVAGKFDLKVFEMRGGFMDRRGPGPGGPGPGRNQPGQPLPKL